MALLFMVSVVNAQPAATVWLDNLNLPSFSEGIPSVSAKKNAGGDSLMLKGSYFERGVGVQSLSVLSFFLDGHARKFTAVAGMDDKGNKRITARFFVIADRKILFESREMKVGDEPEQVDVNLAGVKKMGLLVRVKEEDRNNHKAYSDWADARFTMSANQVPLPVPNTDLRYILTPAPLKTPRINSAEVFGATPGNPFRYTLAATGDRPMHFSAGNLPQGLSIDSKTGIITGSVIKRGTYFITLKAKNKIGEAAKELTIKIGDTIALTPPMGWNGWNSWARNIDAEKVVASADAMLTLGMVNHGWSYINVDDAWQGQRGGKYNAIQPNEKFPAFKSMIDSIHSKGMKFGVYSTPWISSYAGYTGGSSDYENGAYPDSIKNNKRAYRRIGKYRFEKNDAQQMAAWGVDYLKYDWRIDLNSAERMSAALRNSGRDIFYSISNSAPFERANDWSRLANSWRTGSDIRDSWTSLYISAFTIDRWARFGGPGHWNDPDMLILGEVSTGSELHPTRLTPDEQYSHVSLFSLLSAPLMIGCPIERMDSFTLGLLSNDEVIAVDQDPLGKPARLIAEENGVQVWLKPMEDGSYTAGLFNVDYYGESPQSYFRWGDEKPVTFDFDFSKAGLKGKWKIRDLWRQNDLGVFDGTFKTIIRHHGVALIRMYPY